MSKLKWDCCPKCGSDYTLMTTIKEWSKPYIECLKENIDDPCKWIWFWQCQNCNGNQIVNEIEEAQALLEERFHDPNNNLLNVELYLPGLVYELLINYSEFKPLFEQSRKNSYFQNQKKIADD